MINITLDKYYTSKELAKYCINKTYEVIGKENITEIIEPSAGNGSFSNQIERCIAYDIKPENNNIIKQDFFELELEYKKGRLFIGNPPFGRANSLLKKFYKKCIGICDYISFIMPISQLNNDYELYDYDLIYSEDLGKQKYSGRTIHCCLNIYKKPKNKKYKPKHKYKDIEIVGWRKAKQTDCDFYICCYGSSIGQFVNRDTDLVNINGIIIHNEELRDKIVTVFRNANWCKLYPMTSTPNLLQWQIYKHLKEQIPELE